MGQASVCKLCQQQPQDTMLTTIVLAALVAVATADRRPVYQQPSYQQPKYEEAVQYEFGYDVKDEYAGVDFNANENRNGYATNGNYQVALPDGRTQTVTYTVEDGYSGYVADVQYYGEAQYPEAPKYQPKPAYKAHQSVYRPQPSYQ